MDSFYSNPGQDEHHNIQAEEQQRQSQKQEKDISSQQQSSQRQNKGKTVAARHQQKKHHPKSSAETTKNKPVSSKTVSTENVDESRRRQPSISDKVPVTVHPLLPGQANLPTKINNPSVKVMQSQNNGENNDDEEFTLLTPDRQSLGSSSGRSRPTEPIIIETAPDRPSSQNILVGDGEEPLPSGFGTVSKDCSPKDLEGWREVIEEWLSVGESSKSRPKRLPDLVKKGIPEALRGEVWQMLAGCRDDSDLIAKYSQVLTQECKDEVYVRRDIGRTFPAHDFFRETGSAGQESLYRVLKAYAVFDEEVGYCQGFSFIAAALLLHMPEEQAFCVLVKIMQKYGLRYCLKDGFEVLYLRFYQLDRFIEDQIPDLYKHFREQHIESHMYASQWFLTLFTAKFPLYLVFYIMDIFLLEGTPVLFQVALSLLQMSKDDLLRLDFEGILKYFRISLPKNYSSDENARILLQLATSKKVRNQMVSYEKAYTALREQDLAKGNTIKLMQKENKRLVYSNMRLEQENDDLARELISSKIDLRRQLDEAEDRNDSLVKDFNAANSYIADLEEDRKRHLEEIVQLKEVCRREIERFEKEISRNTSIITDYKSIVQSLSHRLEKQTESQKETLDKILDSVKPCSECLDKVSQIKLTAEQVVKNGNGSQEDNESATSSPKSQASAKTTDESQEDSQERRLRELELELAQTKLALVEAECINQDLIHDLNSAHSALDAASSHAQHKSTWISKTLTTIREAKNAAASKKDAVARQFSTGRVSRENSKDFSS